MGKKYNQKNFAFKNGKIIHVAQEKTQKYHKIWLGFMDEDGLSSATFHGLKTFSNPPNPFSQFEYYSNGVFVDESNMNHDFNLTEEDLVHYVFNDWLPDEGLQGTRRENFLPTQLVSFSKNLRWMTMMDQTTLPSWTLLIISFKKDFHGKLDGNG